MGDPVSMLIFGTLAQAGNSAIQAGQQNAQNEQQFEWQKELMGLQQDFQRQQQRPFSADELMDVYNQQANARGLYDSGEPFRYLGEMWKTYGLTPEGTAPGYVPPVETTTPPADNTTPPAGGGGNKPKGGNGGVTITRPWQNKNIGLPVQPTPQVTTQVGSYTAPQTSPTQAIPGITTTPTQGTQFGNTKRTYSRTPINRYAVK